jgi:hypothetical protein
MNSLKIETSPQEDDAAIIASVEGTIREIVRGEVVSMPKARAEAAADRSSDTIGPLIQKVSATSIGEIENLINELEAARSYLQSEADRIQREMARYAHLSNTASASVKIITQSLGQWRNANDAARNASAEGARD